MVRHVTAVLLLLGTNAFVAQPDSATQCQSNIVSSTVVATFCGHREGDQQVLDLYIMWRGRPGWFQQRHYGGNGGGGYRASPFARDLRGYVSEHSMYGDTMIVYDADFDAHTAVIGQATVNLNRFNVVVVDGVDADWQIGATRLVRPDLPLIGDVNLMLARRSRDVLRDLRCEVPMPAPPPRIPQVAVITVCEKLKQK